MSLRGISRHLPVSLFFFFNDTATTEIYTLSLHDALPIFAQWRGVRQLRTHRRRSLRRGDHELRAAQLVHDRSEEHTSELQSQSNIVCRLLLEKKKSDAIRHCRLRARIAPPIYSNPADHDH